MRFLELDALRGIASLTVLLFHFTRFSSGTSPFNYNIGATGVDFFFMLSGFVILMTLDKKPSVGQFFGEELPVLSPPIGLARR
jgi:peptidoglycan/LPS O-acetylase OafA/YrhL